MNTDPGSNTGRRGQIILVSGLALALSLVALVLILNSAVYTENLATRGDDVPATEALAYREDARQGVAGVIEYANQHNNTSESDLKTALERGVDNWNRLALQHAAIDGRAANATLEPGSVVYGTQLGQNGERVFTDASPTPSTLWTPARDVSEMDRLRMNVSRGRLAPSFSESFVLRFRDTADATRTWSLYVYDDGGTTKILTDDFSGSRTSCTDIDGDFTEIDVVRGTVGEKRCAALDFVETAPSSYSIEIENGDDAYGTYELVTDPTSTGTAPYVTPAIRAATVELHYESSSLQYGSTVTAEPHDPGVIGPVGSSASSSDGTGTDSPPSVTIDEDASYHTSSGSNHDFSVSGSAADDQTILTVEIQLYDPSDNLVRTKRESSANSSVTFTDVRFDNVKIRNKDSGTYRIVVTTYDDTGQRGTDEWAVDVS